MTPDLVLQKPYFLVQQQPSVLSGQQKNSSLMFGMIMLAYQTSDNYMGGDTITYNSTGQELVVYDNIEYALIREEQILNKETAAP